MNTPTLVTLIIVTLLLAVSAWFAERQYQRAAAAEKRNAALERNIAEADRAAADAYNELRKLQAERPCYHPRPAHFVLKGGLSEAEIAERLAGLEGTEAIKAICALLGAQIVALADRATDAPRSPIVTPERIIAGYSAEERLHDAGGAAHLAALLARLEELTAPREEAGEKPTAAQSE